MLTMDQLVNDKTHTVPPEGTGLQNRPRCNLLVFRDTKVKSS